jgi:hypothetical protein
MSIKINANFELGAAQFLDQREAVETIDELLALNTNIIPDGFEVYVKEKDCKYKYNSTYTESDTGCWKKTESSGASSDSRELTYEEYMKLSEEERRDRSGDRSKSRAFQSRGQHEGQDRAGYDRGC